jgi:hypothetical protein
LPGTEYAQIFDGVPQGVLARLVRVRRHAVSSPASFDWTTSWAFGEHDRLRQVRNLISQGRSDRLTVSSVHMMRPDLSLWKNYELHVRDPDHSDQFYLVIVSRFGWFYAITAVGSGWIN